MKAIERIKAYIESGEFDTAREELRQCDFKLSNSPEFLSLQSILLVQEGLYHEAENILWSGIEKYPEDPDLQFNLAYVYYLQENHYLALGFFEKALSITADEQIREDILRQIQDIREIITESSPIIGTAKQPLVSIVVLAYNKLDYTKLCVDSILRYTSHINYELILVNNGSTDGTKEFFESISNGIIVDLEQNVGPVNGFNEGMKAARGKYTACVCNDFIFTPRWMDNLLACIESDDKIGFVSPGANYISNHQRIDGVYSNLEEMLAFAEQYNQSNPLLWEERVRLLPCVLMVRTKLLKEVGYFDPAFYFGEFADDDLSFRIRRAGYKLIFAGDTFTYHFGSITTGVDQRENNSLSISREIFANKHGIDAWSDASFNKELIDLIDIKDAREKTTILGVNARCGGNPLQLKNKLRSRGINEVELYNFTQEIKYLKDLCTVSDYAVGGDINQLNSYFKGNLYHYIILDGGLESYHQIETLLKGIKSILHPKGHLVFSIKNPSYYQNIVELINGNNHEGEQSLQKTLIWPDNLAKLLNSQGYHIVNQYGLQSQPSENHNMFIHGLARLFGNEGVTSSLILNSYIYTVKLEDGGIA